MQTAVITHGRLGSRCDAFGQHVREGGIGG
jgi:hypothetical protein